MDWSRFGLSRRPFGVTADPNVYFPSTSTESALADLRAAFVRGEGIALLDGPAGVGKTLTALAWLERLPPTVSQVWLANAPAAKPADLLQAILFDLNEPYQGLNEQELRLAVTAQLLKALQAGTPVVLVIDEAQHLGAEALEELRLLGNVENRHGKGLFALLIAQPSLRDALKQPAYEPFAQRLATACELQPFPDDESRAYLRHHVALAGGDADAVLGEEAQALLTASCGGLPRVLNRAAGLAFDLALAAEAEAVDAEAVLEALSRLDLEPVEADEAAAPDEAPRPAQPAPAANSRGKSAGTSDNAAEPADASPPKQKASRRKSA